MKKSEEAIKKCAEWLAYCLSIGWKKELLNELEKIWWKHHDYRTGLFKNKKGTN